MRKLFLIPAAVFIIGAPLWSMYARLAYPAHPLFAFEFLIVMGIQAGIGIECIRLALRKA